MYRTPACVQYSRVILRIVHCAHCNIVEKMKDGHRPRLKCPQCRVDSDIPLNGFPICRLSQYFRDQLQQCNSPNANKQGKYMYYNNWSCSEYKYIFCTRVIFPCIAVYVVGQVTRCFHCDSIAEARCATCTNFVCYK